MGEHPLLQMCIEFRLKLELRCSWCDVTNLCIVPTYCVTSLIQHFLEDEEKEEEKWLILWTELTDLYLLNMQYSIYEAKLWL
jgi:hypothetical protein